MKLLLDSVQLPIADAIVKWTVLLALGWAAHWLLRSRDARWRLILWRGIFCFGLSLPLLPFLPLPTIQIPFHVVARNIPTAPVRALNSDIRSAHPQADQSISEAVAQQELASLQMSFISQSRIPWPTMLLTLWGVGGVCGAIRLIHFKRKLSTLEKNATPAGAAITELARKILREAGVRRSVRVLNSDSAISPFVFGVMQPAIMLPGNLARSLSPEETRALLGHEIAHVRQNDLFWCIGWRWMQVIYWFHPLVWKVSEAHCLACEEEADRVASCHLNNRGSYARILARLSLRVLAIPQVEAQLTANGTAQISQRLRRLGTDMGAWKEKNSLAAFGLVLAMALVSAGCRLTTEKVSSQEVEQSQSKVARLETRISEMEQALQHMRSQFKEQERQLALREKSAQEIERKTETNAPAISAAPESAQVAEKVQERPRVIAMSPRLADAEVDPAIREIAVTFDRDMSTAGMSWTGSGPEFPPGREGQQAHWRDQRTCVFPVRLEAGHHYRVGINSTSYQNFRSATGEPASHSVLYFTTQGASEAVKLAAVKPVLVSSNPPKGATDVDPDLKELRVTFNVPMGSGFSWCGGGDDFPEIPLDAKIHWTEDQKTCVLPVVLKPDHHYNLRLNSESAINFQSASGVPLDSVNYSFNTK